MARAVSGSVSRSTACSGHSKGPSPSTDRAIAVCSTGTKYGWAPSVREPASSSIFGPERGEHPPHGHRRPLSCVGRSVHAVEVGAHGRQGSVVMVAPQPLDDDLVAHAHPHQGALGKCLGQTLDAADHRHGVAAPDVGDAGGADDARRRREEQREVQEDIASGDLGEPDGAVAEFFEFDGELARARGGNRVEVARPDPDRIEAEGRGRCGDVAHAGDDRRTMRGDGGCAQIDRTWPRCGGVSPRNTVRYAATTASAPLPSTTSSQPSDHATPARHASVSLPS